MNGRLLRRRILRRARREALRLTGESVAGVFALNVRTAERAAEWDGVAVTTFSESRGLTSVVPRHCEPEATRGLEPFDDAYEAIILDIANPRFSFRGHVVVDPQLRLVYPDAEPEAAVLRFRSRVPRLRRHVAGTVAYLSNFWVDNYHHWMQLTLPLLRLYATVLPLDRIDYFYVGPSWLRGVQEETLAAFGVEPGQILRDACSADRALAAFLVHPEQNGPGFTYRDSFGHAFVREAVAPDRAALSGARLYVPRGPARNRRLLNERALIEFLAGRGFVIAGMEGRPVREQAALFAGADVVVAVHGAALTNLLFSRAGSAVLEIFPPSHIEVSHFAAATHSRLRYHYAIGRDAGRSNQDFCVDLEKVEQLLAELGVG